MASTQIQRIQSKLDELRQLDPEGEVLFGAADYQYSTKPPASEELLQQFEAQNNLVLPEGYREFLLNIGNGGAGPHYGLYELKISSGEWAEVKPREGAVTIGRFSSLPEYSMLHWETQHANDEEADDAFYDGMHERALLLCTQGCAIDTFLVLDGPRQGQMWTRSEISMFHYRMGFWPETFLESSDLDRQIQDLQESDVEMFYASEKTDGQIIEVYDINPFGTSEDADFFDKLTDDGPLFLDWYEHWLDSGLYALNKKQ